MWWQLPKRQINRFSIEDAKAQADVEDNFRKTIGQLLVGVMVLVGAGVGAAVAYRQLLSQQQASHDLLVSNQVSKGFEQLGQAGSDKVVIRLGGIYALGGVMNTSEEYHQPILEALSAFVRDNTRNVMRGYGPPATDIQAALTVIGRRAVMGRVSPNLANAHISKADLRNAHLGGANLGEADLSHASVIGADLRDADLSGADLSGSNLSNVLQVHTPGEQGGGVFHVQVFAANLTGAIMSGTNLSDADLSHANLSRAFLYGANLSGATLVASTLMYANLTGATVSQEQLDKACGTDAMLDPGLTLKPCP